MALVHNKQQAEGGIAAAALYVDAHGVALNSHTRAELILALASSFIIQYMQILHTVWLERE